MKKLDEIKKHIALYMIGLWGILSFIYLMGDPIDENIPLSKFLVLKLIGFLSLAICILAGRALDKAGYFPELPDKEDFINMKGGNDVHCM